MFVDLREPGTDKLLGRYDADRDILEIQRRGIKTIFDLTQYGTSGGNVGAVVQVSRTPAGNGGANPPRSPLSK